ncbi:winged helix DNA-binding domain-containing protein [Flindersiella endophytica]
MAVRRIDVAERRARLGVRHHLAVVAGSAPAAAPDLVTVARDLVGLHGTDPASAYVAAAVRTGYLTPDAISKVLYEDRSVVRMLGMRRTMFYQPVDLMPMVQAACTDAIAARERKRLMGFLADDEIAPDVEAWFSVVEGHVLKAIETRGEATAAELGADEPLLRTQIVFARGKPYEGKQSISTRALFILAAEGHLIRGRPVGTWLSSQHRWAWAKTFLPEQPAMAADDATVELVGRWLRAFGPGTLVDLKWWTGLGLGVIKKALAKLDVVDVDLDGQPGLVLASDAAPVAAVEPWVAMLPGLDPTPMGWKERDFYLSAACRSALFDVNGNIGPSIWADGRIVGGWAQTAGGAVQYRLIEKVNRDVRKAVEANVERLAEWFGGVRVIPRFRTPLEKELGGPA